MADNSVAPGTGETFAFDDIGGVKFPRVKLVIGADGVNSGDVSSANLLPVSVDSMPAADATTDDVASADLTGIVYQAGSPNVALTVKRKSLTVAASQTDASVVAAVAAKKIRVLSLAHQCAGTATTATYESDATVDTRLHKVPAGANGGQVLSYNPHGWFETLVGEALIITTGTGSDTEITLTYVEAA